MCDLSGEISVSSCNQDTYGAVAKSERVIAWHRSLVVDGEALAQERATCGDMAATPT